MKTLDSILERYNVTKEDIENDNLDPELFEELYEFWLTEMPYGTAKARTGDPDQWIFDRLCQEFGI